MSIVAKKIMMGSGAVALPSDDQFNRVSFLSHFEGSNNGVNNAFDDGSASNHTITANGNVTQGSFGPFARPDGEWGVSFDGTNDGLRLQSSDFGISTEAFTAECWVFPTKVPDDYDGFMWCMDATQSNASGNTWSLRAYNGKVQIFTVSSGSLTSKESTASLNINAWNHVAISRSGTTMYVALNGTVESATCASSLNNQQYLHIGCGAASGYAYFFQGVISNARYLVGTALYTSDYTVPTGKLTAITNTDLLTCQSNRFVDNSASGHAITITGEPAVTAFGPFLTSTVYDPAVNGASAYFDGNGDALRVSDTASLRIGTGQYTIECWFWFDVLTSNNSGIFAKRDSSSDYWRILATSSGVNFRINSDVVSDSTVVNRKCWNHIAITRDSNNDNRIYVNGSLINTISSSVNISNTGTVRLGEFQADTGPMTGYICDARIVIGTAVYTGSSLTPPTAPLTAITNTKLLLNMADGQAIDSAAQINLTLAGNAKISTGQAKFGNTSMVFDGTGDYVTLPSDSFTPFGTGDFTIECFARFDAISGQGVFQLGASYLPSAITGPAVFGTSDGGSARWRMYYATSYADNTSNPPSTNTWFHIAFVRASGVSKVYIDGVEVLSENDTTDYTNKFFVIGGAYSSSYLMDGYIDDFRISHFARYTSNNFTPPSAAFPDKGQQT